MIECPRHAQNARSMSGEPRVAFDALPQEKCLEAVCVGPPLVQLFGEAALARLETLAEQNKTTVAF